MNDLVRSPDLRPLAERRHDAAAAAPVPSHTRAAPVRTSATVRGRRRLVAGLTLAGVLALIVPATAILAAEGLTLLDAVMLVCFALAAPWTVLGLVNATIGFVIARRAADPVLAVAPFAAAGARPVPVRGRVGVFMTLRNEDPARAVRRLAIVRDSLEATGEGEAYSYLVLSDTSDPAIAAAEEAEVAAWRRDAGAGARILYRRRSENIGFKAGNVRDFVETHGARFDLMLPLDADSLMSGEEIVRMTRIMEAHPQIGILQSLVVGAPSTSAFARIFQFGMRQGMRPYTLGSAWWTAECGPYWGHNALVRIAPFREHCRLPTLPGSGPLAGHVLSHDQVEAVLMRRAGYEVRVIPREGGSWEDNPPTFLDFSKRDLRWCQGNLQYLSPVLLLMKGLLPTSRMQLISAIMMFAAVPAMTAILALAPLVAATTDPDVFPVGAAIAFYTAFLALSLAPRALGLLDVALTPGGMAAYGGRRRFLASGAIEFVFSALLGAAASLRLTLFMIGLAFGRATVWNGQARDAHGLSWRDAARGLWSTTAFGIGMMGLVLWLVPAAWPVALVMCAGYLLAIPFAVLTAAPEAGRALARAGLCAIPEEIDPPAEIRALAGERTLPVPARPRRAAA
ncbi:glucans biosynthesis glucosyltransferase MdoH [Salinarimonas ramus]|uniref:Glucans biosynthesis glucosyltransferase H n=1 Tax=Salinarimonas ramus TaxID=690164 RepID=A0A917QBS5_9HYPH|nr:glucans biosynthesis glucosyltransferase MdoH [Salinarimonas ramus]GGK41415.1 glucans biosynthesis glucosyltransferase H [Salinarimonas ramus]